MFHFDGPSYTIGLILVGAFALATGAVLWREQLLRSCAAVVANWMIGTAFITLTGWTDCWGFNIILDAATATLVLWHPASRMQALIGVSYCVQIAMHIGYGTAKIDLFVIGARADPWKYYDALTAIAWIQLALLGGWGSGLWLWRIADRRRGVRLEKTAGPLRQRPEDAR